jgi:hypothetical protein
MLRDEQAEHAEQAVLLKMDPFDRVVALAHACIESETGAVRQAETLCMICKIMGEHLNEADRLRLAAYMVDLAIRLVTRWH